MVIGIDGNEANIQNRVGVNKYAFEIIWGIYKLLQSEPDLIVNVYLKDSPLPDMPEETSNFKYKILRGGKMWILTRLMPNLFLDRERPDVFFSPNHYLPLFSPMPKICAVMDLGYLESSAHFRKYDYWQLKLWTAWSIRVSKYVLTISNATKQDIVRLFPHSDSKVVVTYPGSDESLTSREVSDKSIGAVKNRYSIVSDYILYLGTLKPSKNIEGIVRAFNLLHLKDTKLVIAGKKGWMYESVFQLVKDLGLTGKVVFTDYIEESEKAALIKGSEVFLIPSFWEGFGLDVLNSFALGVPVVASNVGSLPEVVGDGGILVDPYNEKSISDGIRKVLEMNKKDYNELVSRGKKQLNKFSWTEASEKTLETLKKAMK
ncbi:MAG TPA: glycosyltransferase family 1 protein [Candidatus Saccharimonadales bacterium]|nr:glycosyltransferase family 1 protein [Candidatus Saccharimonadales bacterium]